MSQKKVVIALGGNALGDTPTEQMNAVKITSRAIVDMIEEGSQVIVVHGNGPQVGMINNAMSALTRENPTQTNVPLSVCVAMSQAYIGYDLQNALREELLNRNINSVPVTTVITQVLVDKDDVAFQNPTKPIGHFMTREQADHATKAYNHQMVSDSGRGFRRVVASPKPLEIIERDAITSLVSQGQLVIACGGGGIPVVRNGNHLTGASAVIDKDFASCLLAKELDADYLIILTAVEKVALHFGTPEQLWLSDLSVDQAETYIREGHFATGSMLPKVEAAVEFARSKKGRRALITQLAKARDGISGATGTQIHL